MTMIAKREAIQRFGHNLRIGRGHKCGQLFAWSRGTCSTKLLDACSCGTDGCKLSVTTWGKKTEARLVEVTP